MKIYVTLGNFTVTGIMRDVVMRNKATRVTMGIIMTGITKITMTETNISMGIMGTTSNI
jgi:hypothetical protein